MPGPVLPASFGRYTLLELVGGGGMASVYRAALSGAGGFEKELAVKVVRPELAIEPQFVEMFLDEARLSARLGHANLVHTFDFGQVGGTWFLAMEFVRGPTLAKLLRIARARGLPLGAARTMHLAGEVARGLGYAHRLRDEAGADLGLVHRDVSPQNILLSREGEVKLADFGIAKAASRSTVTRTGHVRGKCAYMAPEQARGEAIDARTDVFALGVVLWECLTGQPLFDGASDGAVLLQVVQREIPPPSRFGADVPAALDDLVLRMLARNPARRPPNGDEVARELAELKLRLVRSTQETDLAAYQRELSSGTAILDAVGQGGGAGRPRSESIELESAAILEAAEAGEFDSRAETRLPQVNESGDVTRVSRPATGSGERAAADREGQIPPARGDGGDPHPALPSDGVVVDGVVIDAPRRPRAGVAVSLVAGLLVAAAGTWAVVQRAGGEDVPLPLEPAAATNDGGAPAPARVTTAVGDLGHPTTESEAAPAGDEAVGTIVLDDSVGLDRAYRSPLLVERDPEDDGVPHLLAAAPPTAPDHDDAELHAPQELEDQDQPGTLAPVAVSDSASGPVVAASLGQDGAGRRSPTRGRTTLQPARPAARSIAAPAVAPPSAAEPVTAGVTAAAGKTGSLVLTSTLEGDVIAILDGREIARMGPMSPRQFEVPVGRHEIAFRSATSELRCRIHADVKAGEKTSLALQAKGVVEIAAGRAIPRDCIDG